MFYFYSPWEDKETRGFLTISGGIEMEYLPEMGWGVAWKGLDLVFLTLEILDGGLGTNGYLTDTVNLFHATGLFLNPLKTSENL